MVRSDPSEMPARRRKCRTSSLQRSDKRRCRLGKDIDGPATFEVPPGGWLATFATAPPDSENASASCWQMRTRGDGANKNPVANRLGPAAEIAQASTRATATTSRSLRLHADAKLSTCLEMTASSKPHGRTMRHVAAGVASMHSAAPSTSCNVASAREATSETCGQASSAEQSRHSSSALLQDASERLHLVINSAAAPAAAARTLLRACLHSTLNSGGSRMASFAAVSASHPAVR
jgi:hypothetical protein